MSPWLKLVTPSQGSYLQEFQTPYQPLYSQSNQAPALIHTVGNRRKYEAINSILGIPDSTQDSIVNLVTSQYSQQNVMLFDCPTTWRTSKIDEPRIKKPGYLKSHSLEYYKDSSDFQTTIKLHARLLGGFSHTVTIFVDDFHGSSSVIELIVAWARNSQREFHSRPRLILISQDFGERFGSRSRLLDRLFRYFTRVQQMADPTRPFTRNDIEGMFWGCFESLHLLPYDNKVWNHIMLHTNEMLQRRSTLGWAFSGPNLLFLLRRSVARFATNPMGSSDSILELRAQDPEKKNFESHIETLLRLTPRIEFSKMARIIASALYMDGYPKGGHRKYANLDS